jgi:hypothetical protein
MRTINIATLINYLNTKTSITNIVWNRIFFWLPNSEQTQDYITINIISENRPTSVENKNRVEFRYIWWSTATTFITLQILDNIIFEELESYKQDWVYKVINSNYFNWYDDKWRKFVLRDLIFQKTV